MQPASDAEAEQIRAIERARLRALVAADIPAALPLHADDFQLITPTGRTLSKEQYLAAVSSGDIHYLSWQPDEAMAVRLHGPVALIRYRAELTMGDPEQPAILHCWHTDLYERRGGAWQVVWSQATQIR